MKTAKKMLDKKNTPSNANVNHYGISVCFSKEKKQQKKLIMPQKNTKEKISLPPDVSLATVCVSPSHP